MPVASRTLNPLHFEDLEPKRFEDLVRQLVYDFKPWRRLEATGRSGSDDGFDARGYEILGDAVEPAAEVDAADDDSTEAEEVAALEGSRDRLWLVQCKREREIGPKKLLKYLDDIHLADGEQLYGIVFTAAADFSKRARDEFGRRCGALGVREWHLWGKAELEDRLFRPENDPLLFAYFGVSLAIRRRSQRTELRARLAMKRKVRRLLEPRIHSPVLLRSPEAHTYPYLSSDDKAPRLWKVHHYHGMRHDGAMFRVHRHLAWLSDDGKSWDAAIAIDDARPWPREDPWSDREEGDNPLREAAFTAWSAFPERNRAWMEVFGLISFENIVDIDELGDDYVEEPHVYVPFMGRKGPFDSFSAEVESIVAYDGRRRNLYGPNEDRVTMFPEEARGLPNTYSTSSGRDPESDSESYAVGTSLP